MYESYDTIARGKSGQGEFIDRKSRFIAKLIHVESDQQAQAFLEQVRSEHYNARHHVPAWILSDGTKRCSDDGEPQRTAGMPILEVLEGAGLKDVCCVCTRYFGGVLLGPGGLIRAYSQATKEAIASAKEADIVVSMQELVYVSLTVAYPLFDQVTHMVDLIESAKVENTAFSDVVDIKVKFLAGTQDEFVKQITELTRGETACRLSETIFGEF